MITCLYRLVWIFAFPLLLQGCGFNAKKAPVRKPVDTCNICSIIKTNPDWYRHTETAARRWGSSTPLIMAMIKKESDFRHNARPVNPAAKNKKGCKKQKKYLSSAYGYAQALNGTWDHYRKQTGKSRARRDDFADCVQFIGWYNDQSRKKCRIKKHDTYNLYLAYHEGHEGYNRKTHKKKKNILNYARQVDSQAKRYAAQLKKCPVRKQKTQTCQTQPRRGVSQKKPAAGAVLSQSEKNQPRHLPTKKVKVSPAPVIAPSKKIAVKKVHRAMPSPGAGKTRHAVRLRPVSHSIKKD